MLWPMLRGWGEEPFAELHRLQRDMNRLVEDFSASGEAFPSVNAWCGKGEAVVTAEVPGVDAKDLEIDVKGDLLTLRGERRAPEPAEGTECYRCERWTGVFARAIRLPFEVEADAVRAACRNGILTIRLPRSDASKPRRVQITAG